MAASRSVLAGLLALTSIGACACTSEAHLGSWTATGSTASLHGDASTQAPGDEDSTDQLDPDSEADAAVVTQHMSPLCLRNPSLDGLPHGGPVEPGTWWPPEAWDLCFNAPEDFPDPQMAGTVLIGISCVNDASTIDPKDGSGARSGFLLPPTHGVGYLYLDTLRGLPERTSQQLCATLRGGVTYNFAIDLASRVGQTHEGATLREGVLEIYGSNATCGQAGAPLWRSPPLTNAWQAHCVSLTPDADTTFLTLQLPADALSPAAILIDNIRLDSSCGPGVVAPD